MAKSERAPKARRNQLVVKELANETLIYDENNHQAHCLNQISALIWRNCNGRKSIPALARLLEKEMKVAVPEQTVWLAIRQLDESRLLEASRPVHLPRTTRRDLVRTLGVAALAVPVITSIIAPRAASAASGPPPCQPGGSFCSPPNGTQGNCCAGFVCNGLALCVTPSPP